MADLVDVSDAALGPLPPPGAAPMLRRVRLAAGGQVVAPQPLLWPAAADEVEAQHAQIAPAPDVDLYLLPHARLAGPGALPARADGAYLFAPTLLPEYVRVFVRDEIHAPAWRHPPHSRAVRLPRAISLVHYNFVFGHWLLEMFPKLLMLKYLLPQLRDAPIVLPSKAPAFVRSILAEVLGDWPVVTYDQDREHVEVEQLFAPGAFQVDYHFHPDFAELLARHVRWARRPALADLRAWIRRRGAPAVTGPSRRKLFVSRRFIVSEFRALTNAADLEAIAVEHGYGLVHPQRLSWREQVRTFARAERLIGEFGSGLHNALFAAPGARVICLNWIVNVQSRIANFRAQRIGYLLAPDNRPRLYSLDGGFSAYEIDPTRFRAVLAAEAG